MARPGSHAPVVLAGGLLAVVFAVPVLAPATSAPVRATPLAADAEAPTTIRLALVRPARGRHAPRARVIDAAVRARLAAPGTSAARRAVRLVPVETADPATGQETADACERVAARLAAEPSVVGVLDASPTCLAAGPGGLGAEGDVAVVDERAAEDRRIGPADDDGPGLGRAQARAAARFLRETRPAARALVVHDGSARGADDAAAFVAEAAAVGLPRARVVRVVGRTPASGDRWTEVAAGAAAVYLLVPSAGGRPGWAVLHELREAGFEGVVVSALGLHERPAPELQAASVGALLTASSVPSWAVPEEVRLADAADRLLDAVVRSGGTRAGLRRALPGIAPRGALRPLGTTPGTHGREIALLRVVGGGLAFERIVGG